MLRCFGTGQIELSVAPSMFATEVPDRPKATAYARLQAEASNGATNLRHEYVRLSGFERHVLRYLDGTKDQPAILDQLSPAIKSGELVFRREGMASGSTSTPAEALADTLHGALDTRARRCFIMAS